ncbi:hypothetical protein JDV02_000754 [Purpureocillium takamizusanense]|uniref:Uncharacterized protein n=1 Tax=Purpureocillium takamizusanense TaxID=2060973 RepID=A0A9Q8Q7F3_9HYPO|nr:uncharacterized protein JDV02_000754 [Purpureocillium takamizusanense]UNI14081.1 hypothetical protein JDV02_000754 [Purpureocillium takamizusanense]
MRFGITVGSLCAVLFGLGAVAMPADPSVDACCCCDISRNVISCTRSIKKAECVCAAVVCPPNAQTVFDDAPQSTHHARAPAGPFIPPIPTPDPVNVVTPPPPAGADNTHGTASKPTPLPVSEKQNTVPPKSGVPDSCFPANTPLSRCCCCNIAKNVVECKTVAQGNCFCAAVVCPAGAKTMDVPPAACASH